MPDSSQKFYLTTPIYYVNARPHIGHAYTTVVADVIARRHRLLGHDTYLLTGTDEHGQKIDRSALAAGVAPQQFADTVSQTFRDLWDRMGITYNDFIRTTEHRHKQGVQRLFQTLKDRGHIYLSTYTGQYCVSDEAYVDGPPGVRCPDCGRVTETVSESNYYFRLSAFQLPLLDLIESNQLLITPETRRNEVLSFLRGNTISQSAPASPGDDGPGAPSMAQSHRDMGGNVDTPPASKDPATPTAGETLAHSAAGTPFVPGALKDLSISRTSFKWGVPVPGDEAHVIYVWLDALANYMTALGYGSDAPEDIARFERFWPADLHLVGKEIIRFHCVYWPAFLLAAGLPTPEAITAHGWLLFQDSSNEATKMSKSKGNIVRTETILDAFGEHVYGKQFPDSTRAEQDLFATDVLRYFLLREIPFGQDGSFSFDALIQRYNADLANGYGNLVSRTLKLIEQNFPEGFERPEEPWICEDRQAGFEDEGPETVREAYSGTAAIIREFTCLLADYSQWFVQSKFQICLAEISRCVGIIDSYLSWHKPWKLAKETDPAIRRRLIEVLYTAAESIRIITALLYPFLPFATAEIWKQLGSKETIEEAAASGGLRNLTWDGLKPATRLGPLSPIFPRADKGLAQTMADIESSNAPSPSKLTNETTSSAPETTSDPTHPAAPPRTGSLPEFNPIAQVAGSASAHTELHKPPSHTEAAVSGPFNTSASAQPIAGGEPANASPHTSPQITIDDFAKVDLRVARILVCERIPKADKLLRLEVDLGYEQRQILSGIAEFYTPEELIGRKIVVITNLAPRKMRGLESHGMLLAASTGENGKPALATFADSDNIEVGARLK